MYARQKQLLKAICFSLVFCSVSAVPAANINPLLYSNSKDFVTAMASDEANTTLEEVHKMVFGQMDEAPNVHYLPAARIMQKLNEASPICAVSRLKTEERETYLFSSPVAAFLSPRLFQPASNQPISDDWLDHQGHVESMPALFNSGEHGTLLLLRTRSYGDFLDRQIAQIEDSYLRYRWGADGNNKDVQMLLKERADFILVYPANVYLEKSRFGGPPLRSYAIHGAPQYALSYTMCNDRPASRAWLARFNRAMAAVYGSDEYINAHLNYVADESKAELKAVMAEAELLRVDEALMSKPIN